MKKNIFCCILILTAVNTLKAQTIQGQTSGATVITTAVPFLTITPDSRSAGLGDAGAATSADVNASFWNPGKLVTIEKGGMGFSASYTPWLAKIINDMKVMYLTGFYRIDQNQVVSASLKYFDMGEIQFTNYRNVSQGNYNPREYAVDVTYSRRLTENFNLGGSLRYIRSNLTGTFVSNARAGNSVAADIGVFYTKHTTPTSLLSLGAVITNFGSQMTYTSASEKEFIPTNLRLGGAYKIELSPLNTLTFIADLNKLMVPSPPYSKSNPKTFLSGVLGSFSDASFKEEMQEIRVCTGVEYWFKDRLAGRIGYSSEAKNKGNRKYITIGFGFHYEVPAGDEFGFDVAYMTPTTVGNNALAETLRVSLFYVLPIKRLSQTKSVTSH